MRPNRPWSLILALVLASLPGCAEGGSGAAPATAVPEVRSATAGKILEAVREPGARVVVVNVWATWCEPCREEFPDLVRLYRKYGPRGLRMIFVSADFEAQIAVGFLAAQGVDFPTYLKAGDDMEFINTLESRWSGALPATFVYDGAGALRRFWVNKTSYRTVEREVLAVLESRGDG